MVNTTNFGWLKKVPTHDWHLISFDQYPGWELEKDHPAFAKLTHVRGPDGVESHKLACEWDDIAIGRFYQRDWTDDGIPFVQEGASYWSGWWFETIAERDRFLEWFAAHA